MGLARHGRSGPLEGFQLNNRWDDEEATGLLRAALTEIEALSDELSPARAEVLLDEFELDVGSISALAWCSSITTGGGEPSGRRAVRISSARPAKVPVRIRL